MTRLCTYKDFISLLISNVTSGSVVRLQNHLNGCQLCVYLINLRPAVTKPQQIVSQVSHTVRSVAAAVRKNSAKCKKPATQRRKHSTGTSYCRFLLISVEMLVQYVAFTSTRDMIKSLQDIKKTNYLIKSEASTKVTNQKHQFLIRDNQL